MSLTVHEIKWQPYYNANLCFSPSNPTLFYKLHTFTLLYHVKLLKCLRVV